MRFIHMADVHLGAVPDEGKPWSERRKRELWASFTEVFAVAKQAKVDMVLIAGDLFHRQPLVRELKELDYIFRQVPEIRIVMIAGNHDFMSTGSNYRSFSFSPNVTFLKGNEIEHVYFKDLNTSVYGKSYWHREEPFGVYHEVVPENPNHINILLAHGGDSRHLPFSPEQIEENGFDYVACGHIHKGGILEGLYVQPKLPEERAGMREARAVMAGALEPIDCNDTGEHGFWIGEVSKAFSQVQFCPIRRCRYIHEIIQVAPHMTNLAVQTVIRNLLANRKPYEIYKIYLEGSIQAEVEIDLDWIRNQEAVVEVVDNLRADYNYESLRKEHEGMLLGRFIAAMQSQGDSEVYQKALEIGVDAILRNRIDT